MPAAAKRTLAADTSVAIPLLLRNHEAHQAVTAWRANRKIALSGHAWIETYAVLTRLPGSARVAATDAVTLLTSNFSAPLAAQADTLRECVDILAAAGIAGGAAYDGLVALAARDHGAVLASRDIRAEPTYRWLGVEVEMIA